MKPPFRGESLSTWVSILCSYFFPAPLLIYYGNHELRGKGMYSDNTMSSTTSFQHYCRIPWLLKRSEIFLHWVLKDETKEHHTVVDITWWKCSIIDNLSQCTTAASPIASIRMRANPCRMQAFLLPYHMLSHRKRELYNSGKFHCSSTHQQFRRSRLTPTSSRLMICLCALMPDA